MLFFGLLWIILFYILVFLFPPPTKSEVLSNQVVLQVVSNGSEEKLVVPKAVVILRLAPISGDTAKAPLSNGDLLVCHPYGFKDDKQNDHAGFKCGNDIYVIAGIRYQDSKR